jgi:L-iditol 2-dehydrogenase
MRAARLLALGDMRAVDVPVPDPAPGEILVKIEAAGICGTDRHLFKGEFPCTPPVTLGHEFSGIVVALGAGVTSPAIGTRVTCDPNISCGTCPPCRLGRVNLCERLTAIGIHRDGGFAEFAAIPAAQAHPLPADLDPLWGAFSEPLACCLHGADIAAIQPGERVIVVGGGVIGMLALQLAALAGAEVLLLTRHEAKRALARDLGATLVPTPDEALRRWPGGADAVVECAGVAETVALCPRLARRGGRVVILGVLAAGEKVAIEPFDLLFREVQLRFAFVNPFTQGRAAAHIASGRVKVAPLVSRIIALDEVPATVAAPARPGEIKVVAVPA